MIELNAHIWILITALAIDAIIGDPDFLWRKFPHPVVWIGKVINWLDETFNKTTSTQKTRRLWGVFSCIFLVILAASCAIALQYLIHLAPLSPIIEALIVAVLLSTRSLYDHVKRVATALDISGLGKARIAVAKIVGRDPQTLDRAGVSRAAIESLAENFSDGVIAPALWYLVGGLPGLLIYKTVNTADSMIGHKSERHLDFGWASARFDDLINLPASRLTALLCVFATAVSKGPQAAKSGFETIWRDATKHRSPNAGWPEAAMAGALDISLSGPRSYDGKLGNEPWVNATGRKNIDQNDVKAALRLYITSLLIFAGILGLLNFIV